MKGSDILNVIGWSKALLIRFGIVAAFVVLVPLVLNLLFGLDALVGITGVTALILLAYTIETQALRHEVVRQNEIAIQPVLIAGIERRDGRPRFVLRNIGRGPALFVEPQDIAFPEEQGVRTTARFRRVDYIIPEEDAVIITDMIHEGVWGEGDVLEGPREGLFADAFAYHLDPENSPRPYEVIIHYEDINGQRRYSVMQMGRGGIRLLRHGKN